jgi:hypothetical protein
VPVFKNRVALEIVQGIKGLLGEKAGDTRSQRLKRVGQRIANEGRALRAKARRRLGGGEVGGIRPENIVWIFGAGRTGSTWLSQMMGELEGHEVWFEPWVGALFDPYHLRFEQGHPS